MNIIESKMIRCFANVNYLFGFNMGKDVKAKVVEYLENIYDNKLNENIKVVLLNDDLSLNNLNLVIRRYKYMQVEENQELDDFKDIIEIYTIARESIINLNEMKIVVDDSNISVLKSSETLNQAVKHNLVTINYIYAVVNYLGIFRNKNLKVANEYFVKNARWNDEASTLCLIYNNYIINNYNECYYWAKICQMNGFISEENEYLQKVISKVTDIDTINQKINNDMIIHNLLNDDRVSNSFDPNCYDPNLAKIIYDGNFSLSEKKGILFSKQEMDYSLISALVTDDEKEELIDESIKYRFRVKEQKQILQIFQRMINSKEDNPLIITCKDKVMMEIYSFFIDSYFKKHITSDLDVSRFDFHKFDRTYALNNYLYNLVTSNNTSNIVIKYHNLHELNEHELYPLLSILTKNIDYFIQDIKVSINKDNLINVIFSMDINSLDKRIVQFSDVFVLNDIDESEKHDVVYYRFLMELNSKNLKYDIRYDKFIDLITEKVGINNLVDAITKIVSRITFSEDKEIDAMIREFTSTRTIGF